MNSLAKKIKKSKDLEFLDIYQPNEDYFKHSGFACRAGQENKQMDFNSITKPYRHTGFGNTARLEETQHKTNSTRHNLGDLSELIRENPKMEAKKLGELCVKMACREYGRETIPTLESSYKSKASAQQYIINRQPSFLLQNQGNPRQGSAVVMGAATPVPSRPTTAVSPSSPDIKTGRPEFIEPTVSITKPEPARIIRPSSSAPAFKRLQASRKGHHPFDFDVPAETMVEIRCMLHPNIKRDWNYPTDTWFPGMMTKTKEINEKLHKPAPEERRTKPKQYFESKLFQYNEADVQEARSKPIVRCASAYIDPDQAVRQAQLEKDKQIICKRTVYDRVLKKEKVINVPFYTLFKSKQYVQQVSDQQQEADKISTSTATEYRPISAHKFREKNKSQWVAKSDFKLF